LIFGQAVTKILDRIDLSPFTKCAPSHFYYLSLLIILVNKFPVRLFFTVFNPLPLAREKELMTVKLQLQLPRCVEIASLLVADNHGVTCPSHVIYKIVSNASMALLSFVRFIKLIFFLLVR
jgi:hypothetical protein